MGPNGSVSPARCSLCRAATNRKALDPPLRVTSFLTPVRGACNRKVAHHMFANDGLILALGQCGPGEHDSKW